MDGVEWIPLNRGVLDFGRCGLSAESLYPILFYFVLLVWFQITLLFTYLSQSCRGLKSIGIEGTEVLYTNCSIKRVAPSNSKFSELKCSILGLTLELELEARLGEAPREESIPKERLRRPSHVWIRTEWFAEKCSRGVLPLKDDSKETIISRKFRKWFVGSREHANVICLDWASKRSHSWKKTVVCCFNSPKV